MFQLEFVQLPVSLIHHQIHLIRSRSEHLQTMKNTSPNHPDQFSQRRSTNHFINSRYVFQFCRNSYDPTRSCVSFLHQLPDGLAVRFIIGVDHNEILKWTINSRTKDEYVLTNLNLDQHAGHTGSWIRCLEYALLQPATREHDWLQQLSRTE